MVQFDNQYRQVKLKVVYYGPALGGKTTCLQFIHRITDPQRRTKLYALNTAADRTLFFDLLSLDLGRIKGYRLTLQLFTVPGQVQYDATRRAVLAGADGVVFVADSQRSQRDANRQSLSNLADNLRANGLDPTTVPLVLQLNKRDLDDVVPAAEMAADLGDREAPIFESVATTGQGVLEAFQTVTEATVRSVADRLGLSANPETLRRLTDNVRTAFGPLVPKSAPAEVEAPVVVRPDSDTPTFSDEQLVGEAVRANMAMTDLNARLDHLTRQLERRVGQMRSVNEFGRAVTGARAADDVATRFIDRWLSDLRVGCGSLVLTDDAHGPVELLRRGLAADPFLAGGGAAAATVVGGREPVAVRTDDADDDARPDAALVAELRDLGLVSALAVPLVAGGHVIGFASAFADADRGGFDEEDLELASALAATGAVAMANARAWSSLEELNTTLEDRVAQRTAELEQALADTRMLAADLESRSAELESANRQLASMEELKGSLLQRVAHELNTPVTSIRTAAGILGRYGEITPEKAGQFVAIIQQESARLATIIASALEATLLGVEPDTAEPVVIPVAQLLRQVVAPMKAELDRRRIGVQVKIATGLVHVTGDQAQLEAALKAVVKNAIEFNREGGDIVITVRPVRRDDTAFVEIRVDDTGAGIAPEDLPHVTEVMFQGGSVLTGKPRGLGLGLAVARRVADNHGGDLVVESEADSGTSVRLLVPERVAESP